MCGIAGFYDQKRRVDGADYSAIAGAMADAIVHRGPDEGNVWDDSEAGIALGHRRLSIIDLTDAGRQPMASRDGRYMLCYNGEIYNGAALRSELEGLGHEFRGLSDSEALVESCSRWGVEEAIKRSIGMFAFALWDRQERRLTLVRDRLGIKPLYWSFQNGILLFGSELRALRAHPNFVAKLDRDALAAYVRHNYYPQPYSVFQGVSQLPPGMMLTINEGTEPELEQFWSMEGAVRDGRANRFSGSPEEAVDALDEVLGDAVRGRMISDVPLGAFLSGGYDSSTIVALMQKHSSRPVRTFSIGYDDAEYNEAHHAKAVAEHLGCDHTELYVTASDTLDVVPQLPELYDEPFADSSQIPTYLVSKLAREHVTVALSGDGGDELFTGYNRYSMAGMFEKRIAPFPGFLRSAAGGAIKCVPEAMWDQGGRLIPARYRPRLLGDKMHKFADVVGLDGWGFYRRLTSQWTQPSLVVKGGNEPLTVVDDPTSNEIAPEFVERLQYWDSLTYLPGDILTKVDRASMAVSLEARVPLLDHRVVEFAWSLPLDYKLRNGTRKWILRELLYRHVPRALVDRPKMGFGIPIEGWLRGPLKEWAEDLLSEEALRRGGIFHVEPIRRCWEEHLSGAKNWQYALWTILMFEAWRRAQKDVL